MRGDRRGTHTDGVGGNVGIAPSHRTGVGLPEHTGHQRHAGETRTGVFSIVECLGINPLHAGPAVGGGFRQDGVDVASAQEWIVGYPGSVDSSGDTHDVDILGGSGDGGVHFEGIVLAVGSIRPGDNYGAVIHLEGGAGGED